MLVLLIDLKAPPDYNRSGQDPPAGFEPELMAGIDKLKEAIQWGL